MFFFHYRLGTTVSESTIRNLVKIYKAFTPALKDKIGRFAVNCGVEAASTTFSHLLKRDVSQFLVQKFRTIYLNKHPNICNLQQDGQLSVDDEKCNDICETALKCKRYTSKLKEEIGEYACTHTVEETVKLYSKKLKIMVKEQTVRKFHQAYLDKCESQHNSQQSSNGGPLLEQAKDNGPMAFVHQQDQSSSVTLYQLNQHANYHSSSTSVLSHDYNTLPTHPPPPYPLAVVTDFITAQPLQQAILTIIPEKDVGRISRGEQQEATDNFQQKCNPVSLEPSLPNSQEKRQHMASELVDNMPKESVYYGPANNKTQTKKKQRVIYRRGSYTAYSPEIRAEIGKYAAEYGSVKASQHFGNILGHEVPESTARGLREKYLKKLEHSPVTSLGYSQRGRPLRLGKYDELVQECLKDIVRSGEKVSTFLAISTAKEILNKYEPNLLEENGGTLKLNITWAKSFLKRIGVHNNS